MRCTPLARETTLLEFFDQFAVTSQRKVGRSIGRIVAWSSTPRLRTSPEFTTCWVYPVAAEIETGRIWFVVDFWYTVAVRPSRLSNNPKSTPTSSPVVCSGFRFAFGRRSGAVNVGCPLHAVPAAYTALSW